MYQLLLTATKSLHTAIKDDPHQSYLIKVLTLLMIYFKCTLLNEFSSDISNRDFIVTLLQNLTINHSSYGEACNKLLFYYKDSVLQILDIVIENAIRFTPLITEWIFAVPLIHLLSEKCKPFEVLPAIHWDVNKASR